MMMFDFTQVLQKAENNLTAATKESTVNHSNQLSNLLFWIYVVQGIRVTHELGFSRSNHAFEQNWTFWFNLYQGFLFFLLICAETCRNKKDKVFCAVHKITFRRWFLICIMSFHSSIHPWLHHGSNTSMRATTHPTLQWHSPALPGEP